jgi:2,3-bisphosphoglycerate-independent phosphoglycerate mutase
MRNSRLVFVFVDGLGLGDPDSSANPLRDPELTVLANFHPPGWTPPREGGRPTDLPPVHRFTPLPHDGIAVPTDASLGVEGLPQSATGQTTLLTGVNAAQVLGRHLYGYPTKTLQGILLRDSILKRAVEADRKPLFANAFRSIFFDLGDAVWTKPLSATTWANRAAGLPFRDMEDLRGDRAVYQDITHDSLIQRGIPIEPREPEAAGMILARLAGGHDFTLFEFFQTDKAGHAQDEDKAVHELRKLERFLSSLISGLDLTETTVVVTSDHGNIEDLGRKTHTHHPVPTLLFGPEVGALSPRLDRLERFAPVFLECLGVGDRSSTSETP